MEVERNLFLTLDTNLKGVVYTHIKYYIIAKLLVE